MSDQRSPQLFEKWNGGDDAALEEAFRAYEPYLRMVVRRQLSPRLRSKFDSVDVVQTVWTDVLESTQGPGLWFATPRHLRAYLVRLTLNRFVDFCRRYRGSVRRERPLNSTDVHLRTSQLERPSQIVQVNELWARFLSTCSPAHRRLLELKGSGRTPAEIAALTGLHPGSVRRILAELAVRYESREAGGVAYAPRP